MKATDLRQNNLILYNDKIVTVAGTIGDTIYYKGDAEVYFDSNIGETYQPFKPIPLTEEWLLKFGLLKTKNSVLMGGYELIYDDKNNMYNVFVYHGIFCTIKYVHQLQNLYFALTGEELKINQNGN